METKAEKIAVLSNIILHKAQRIKKLKLECGQQAIKICVLNERIKKLEAKLLYIKQKSITLFEAKDLAEQALKGK